MHKLSAQSLGFSLPFSFPVIIFIIILHLPWLCNPLKHFTVLIFTFQLYILPVPSQLCVLHNLFFFHAHVFISPHPLICPLSNLLILDPEYALPLLMLQSHCLCFADAYVFQLLSPTYTLDVYPFRLLFLCCNCFCPSFGVVWSGKLEYLGNIY